MGYDAPMLDDDLRTARPASRPGLPPLSTFLRATMALGRASIGPALPALAFLYFYRLGMGLYLTLSMDPVTTLIAEDAERPMSAPKRFVAI